MNLREKSNKKFNIVKATFLIFCSIVIFSVGENAALPVQAQTNTVEFESNTYVVLENAGSVSINIIFQNNTPTTFTVDWTTQDGTATAGSDYVFGSGTVTFIGTGSGNPQTQTISVNISDNPGAELDETFSVVLSTPTNGIVLGSQDTTTITIIDNDFPKINFNRSVDSVNEGAGSIDVVVNIDSSPISFTPVTVDYYTQNGSAVGADYTSNSGTLTFTSPSTTKTIQIIINNDTISEPTETFYIYLTNPINASIGTNNLIIININDNDVASGTPTPQVFADAQEPNNSFNEATETAADAANLCNLTFYPPGDQDYFRWWGKTGITYIVSTLDLSPGLDTVLDVYNTNQALIASNDDVSAGIFRSEVKFTAGTDGYYYARVTNKSPVDPVNKLYCFSVDSSVSPTPTPPAGFPADADVCEFNSTIDTACLFIAGETKSGLNFVPTLGSAQDTDMFKMWVKPGIYYTCETIIPAGSAADTNMIFLDNNGNPFNPWLGNDDKVPGGIDFGSKVSYLAAYTGWLFIEVGPVNVPPLDEAALHEYNLTCTALESTPTPTPSATSSFTGGTGGTGGSFATATSQATVAFPTQFPTPTPIDFSLFFTPTPAPPPVVQFQPLPTSTPAGGGTQSATINVTLYYDGNNNFLPELTEGIVNAAVALYDNGTGELISFGHTNETGVARFTAVNAAGAVRVVVPFLNYSQVVLSDNAEILVRVAPQPLPIGIP